MNTLKLSMVLSVISIIISTSVICCHVSNIYKIERKRKESVLPCIECDCGYRHNGQGYKVVWDEEGKPIITNTCSNKIIHECRFVGGVKVWGSKFISKQEPRYLEVQ